MLAEHAKAVARQWVLEHGTRLPGFEGAVLTGSVLWNSTLAPDSDVDIMVIGTQPLGKFVHNGVLLEVSAMPMPGSAESVLGHYHLASSFHRPCVLADPTGQLTEIQRKVARQFADERWVTARCEHAMNTVRRWITGMDAEAAFPDQVTSWLFGTGVMTHVLLVAGLRNPTVRRRYAAVRELLAEHDRLDYHEHLLELLGCARMTPDRTRHHLARLETVFDAASQAEAPGYRFASDISAAARPIAIDGSRRMIDDGLHREAVFWLVATYARCLSKLSVHHDEGFTELLTDLNAETFADRRRRGEQVLAALPALAEVGGAVRRGLPG